MSSEYLRTTTDVRKALRICRDVYVTIMMGNMTWAAKITKAEARAILSDIDKNWESNEELGVHSLGFINGENLHLGGL